MNSKMFNLTLFLNVLRGRRLMLSSMCFQTFTTAKQMLNLALVFSYFFFKEKYLWHLIKFIQSCVWLFQVQGYLS